MIKQTIILLSFLNISCNCTKNQISDIAIEKTPSTYCPPDGKCTTILIKNKSLNIMKDDTGAIYYELTNNSNTSVIKFEYNKTEDTTLQDNSYREEVLFEIQNESNEINIENSKLEKVKLLFGKHCFCRGQAGIYIVKKGELKISRKDKYTSFSLEFEIPNIEHIIKKISETIE